MEEANLNYIDELSGGSLDFKTNIVFIIKKELSNEIGVYDRHKETLNFVQMSQSVHKLKHKISILGMKKSYYLAEEYEANLKNNSTNVHSDFESILKNMQEFVNLL
jgi:hypothetical protein